MGERSGWTIAISAEQAGQTLTAIVRSQMLGRSWTQVRQLIAARRVRVNQDVCLDPARRLKQADTVEVMERPVPAQPAAGSVVVRYLDDHLVVVEKPTGISTVRHPSERAWPARRKALSPTLEDIVPKLIARQEGRARKGPLPRLRVVQRLDKETSGLVVFARSVIAERELGRQFHRHTVIRRYLTIVPGFVSARTIRSRLVRDRGDGRRGSMNLPGQGKEAITHIEVVERLACYTLLACRLETGRTHQIRIHLAELGHPICGEKVYNRPLGQTARVDESEAPRLALHAAELGFVHPTKGDAMQWTMSLPSDLEAFLQKLRRHEPRDQVE
jgi:23S rRNA pseudouridine1911/1915/1917 synthase